MRIYKEKTELQLEKYTLYIVISLFFYEQVAHHEGWVVIFFPAIPIGHGWQFFLTYPRQERNNIFNVLKIWLLWCLSWWGMREIECQM